MTKKLAATLDKCDKCLAIAEVEEIASEFSAFDFNSTIVHNLIA